MRYSKVNRVKCPECNKEVAARGLISHIRMAHFPTTTPEGRSEEARATGEKQSDNPSDNSEKQSGNLDNLIDNLVDKLIDNQGEEARAVEEDRQVETRGAGQEPSRAPRSEAQSHKPRKRKKKDSSVALASSGEESGEGGSDSSTWPLWGIGGLVILGVLIDKRTIQRLEALGLIDRRARWTLELRENILRRLGI